MSGVNKAILIGNLGKDPEGGTTQNGAAYCRFSIATNKVWVDKTSQEKKEEVQWHNIVVWNKQAENCLKYLSKGRQVYIEGEIKHRKWTDDSGVDRYSTDIVASTVQFIGGKEDGGSSGSGGYQPPPMTDDDIPF